jgi:drug/metabolite transporter (DMT)-like permease
MLYASYSQNTVVVVNELNESSKGFTLKYNERIFSAISAGVFFIVVGAIFVTTPSFFDNILTFFGDFDLVRVPNSGFGFPAPASPETHSALYSAVTQFSVIWGLFQIVILVLRFVVDSPFSKKAETASNLVYWLGASYLISTLLNEITTVETWFVFWAEIIMLVGVSLIVRAIILAIRM